MRGREKLLVVNWFVLYSFLFQVLLETKWAERCAGLWNVAG